MRVLKIQFLLALSCCLFWQGAIAQSVTTTVTRNSILIGEPIKYRLSFSFPDNDYNIEFNVPDSFPHFEVMGKTKFDSTVKNRFLIVQEIQLTSWDSGSWQIPSFPLKLKKISTGRSYDLKSDSIKIEVGYAPKDAVDTLRDVKPIRGVSFIDYSWIYIAGIVLVALILLYLLWKYLKNKPKQQPREANNLAYVEAIEALNKLRKTDTDTQTSAKQFYTALGEIFKRYYQKKSTQNLDNKTTAEVVALLRKVTPTSQAADFVQEALSTGDAAKFAKYLPAAEENDKCCDFVVSAINSIEQLSKEKRK